MGRQAQQSVDYGPVGDTLYNGYDNGGARNYFYDTALAITPPADYSQNIGPGNSPIIVPPVSALQGSAGSAVGGGASAGTRAAMASPFSTKWSPLPYVLAGLFGAIGFMYYRHYK
jgi:hypothetical protein